MAKLTKCQRDKLEYQVRFMGEGSIFTGTASKDFHLSGGRGYPFVPDKPVTVKRGTPVLVTETPGSLGRSVHVYLPDCSRGSDWDVSVPLRGKKEHKQSWRK